MLKEVSLMFSYQFMQNAFIVGLLVSILAALMGVILVLKKYALLGHGLGDVGFGSLALALALGLPPLIVSIPLVLIAAFLIMYISQQKKIQGDVIIGMISTISLSVGVIITSVVGGFNVNLNGYMFGSILTMTKQDTFVSLIISFLVLTIYILFYHRFLLVVVDENFAKATGRNVKLYDFLISTLTALTIVLGMRMVGSLLISSLLIFPAVSSKLIAKSYLMLVIYAVIISIIAFVLGLTGSYLWPIPTGPLIVMIHASIFILIFLTRQLITRR